MKIVVASIFVDDQDKALDFYTRKLGFLKKAEIPLGNMRWLTVVSPADPNGAELVLEPDCHPAVHPLKKALMNDGIAMTSFAVEDVCAEYDRLCAAGVLHTSTDHDKSRDHGCPGRHMR